VSEQPAPLPAAMAELAEDFLAVGLQDRLQLLLELSDELPALPERYAGHEVTMEQVPECQSPIFLAGLDGLSAPDVLAVPDDAPYRFGLGQAVSPLRLRGMVAMLTRIKRQVRERTGP
jgi:cysteine desulfuration protein SufE